MTIVTLKPDHVFHITIRCYGWLDLEEYAAVGRPVPFGKGRVYDIYARRIASVFVEGERQRPETMKPGSIKWEPFVMGIDVSGHEDDETAIAAVLRNYLVTMNVQSIDVVRS